MTGLQREQVARPLTVTLPLPVIVALTIPSEWNCIPPDPAIVALAVSAVKALPSNRPLPATASRASSL